MNELLESELLKLDSIPHDKFNSAVQIYTSQKYSFLAAGFIAGLAEKTYLGASNAFMVRPSKEWYKWTFEIVELVCKNYSIFSIDLVDLGEIWGFRSKVTLSTLQFMINKLEPNSPEWHEFRGRLCGVRELNEKYHEVLNFNSRCEI